MPLFLGGPVKVKILGTNQVIDIQVDELEIEQQGTGERQMGGETEYEITASAEGHDITWSVWEYPEGMENHREGPNYNDEQLSIIQDLSIEIGMTEEFDDD